MKAVAIFITFFLFSCSQIDELDRFDQALINFKTALKLLPISAYEKCADFESQDEFNGTFSYNVKVIQNIYYVRLPKLNIKGHQENLSCLDYLSTVSDLLYKKARENLEKVYGIEIDEISSGNIYVKGTIKEGLVWSYEFRESDFFFKSPKIKKASALRRNFRTVDGAEYFYQKLLTTDRGELLRIIKNNKLEAI